VLPNTYNTYNSGRCHVVHVVVASPPPGPATSGWLRCRVASCPSGRLRRTTGGAGAPPAIAPSTPPGQQPPPGVGAEWESEASRARRIRPRGTPGRNVPSMATYPITGDATR